MTRGIVHGIEVHSDPKVIFDTIATRAGLAAFWTPDVQGDDGQGGELSFGFSGSPSRLPVRVTRLDPPRGVDWDCPGKVLFRHLGFPDAQPEYDFGSISLTWGQIVTRLKEVVESGGAPNPALG
jgi:hypothetical protein